MVVVEEGAEAEVEPSQEEVEVLKKHSELQVGL